MGSKATTASKSFNKNMDNKESLIYKDSSSSKQHEGNDDEDPTCGCGIGGNSRSSMISLTPSMYYPRYSTTGNIGIDSSKSSLQLLEGCDEDNNETLDSNLGPRFPDRRQDHIDASSKKMPDTDRKDESLVRLRKDNSSIDTDQFSTPPRSETLTKFSRASYNTSFQELLEGFAKEVSSKSLSQNGDVALNPFLGWAQSFRRIDPRHQILSFFNEVAQVGTDRIESDGLDNVNATPPQLQVFDKAGVFTVWRPTSVEAIRKMMLGQGVGKGLDIKGKSAKKGKLSAFVPFLQIHEEKHKQMIRTIPRDGRMRVFFSTLQARSSAVATLQRTCNEMVQGFDEAQEILSSPPNVSAARKDAMRPSRDFLEQDREQAMQRYMWGMKDPTITIINDYVDKQCFGIELPQRLVWEAFVVRQDIVRKGEYVTGRRSEPTFQDMNFESLRNHKPDKFPRPVVFQYADPSTSPMCPLSLLMAYEENGRVLPVVSDFDCFLVGTRGVKYESSLPPEQLDLMQWSVDTIQRILENPSSGDTWTVRWLDVLKKATTQGFHPKMPKYGFGDMRSYCIMAHAVERLAQNGAVRHGAECFNYYFPQELDENFLVLSNHLPGYVKWRGVNSNELLQFLSDKINEGFTFPLNPKNVLCDPGWKLIYDKLMASQARNVQRSLDVWYPKESGIREKIENIHRSHQKGFQPLTRSVVRKRRSYSPLAASLEAGVKLDGTTAMDLAEFELKHHVVLQRAKVKLRAAMCMVKMHREMRDSQNHNVEQRDVSDEEADGELPNLRVG